jgi:hypothetical protein
MSGIHGWAAQLSEICRREIISGLRGLGRNAGAYSGFRPILPMVMKPIYEQRQIKADYKCTYASQSKYSFEPLQRQHTFPDGKTTDLVDIGINLNDEIRKNLGPVKVGTVKDFTLEVQVLAGFEMEMDS